MKTKNRAYWAIVCSTFLWVSSGLFLLLALGRVIISEELRRGIDPFIPPASVPWIAGGVVAFAIVCLVVLSRIALSERIAKAVIYGPGLIVGIFFAFLIIEILTAKRTEQVLPTNSSQRIQHHDASPK